MDANILSAVQGEVFSVWFLIGAALVFFMQCGFAMVESGFTRAKNAGNIIMKNLMDFCLGTPAFLLLGYSLLCGDDIGGFIGWCPIPLFDGFQNVDWSTLVFNLVFCATAATIVSGAMAERTKFISYCVYSVVISLVVYPIEAHWVWGGGWLAQMGFIDFAGSACIHMVGGLTALIGAAILGPRIGKYTVDENGKKQPRAILGHSITLGALGVFILWFAWYGFNGAAATSTTQLAQIFATTTISPAIATITVMIITWLRNGKPDVSMTLNGSLAGLVAITAGCTNIDAFGSALVGIIAGFVVVFVVEFVDKVLHVDDPVGAVAVHGGCGLVGTLLVGLFDYTNGVLYGGGWHLFFVQLTGVVAILAWTAVTMTIVFFLIKKTVGLRVTEEEEILGLDSTEHGLASGYADFVPAVDSTIPASFVSEYAGAVPVESAVPVADYTSGDKTKLTKVTIVTKSSRFETLKAALNEIGVTGITLTNVLGCGMQKGADRYYRGVKVDMNLLPKIKVEVVVCKVPVQTVIDTVKKALYTGNIGDGKIFVYDVENVVKIRTGEEGYDALQDD